MREDPISHLPSPISRTIRLDLSYEGTNYHGFGVQPGRTTIQEVLEGALAQALGERVRVTPAGRTDAGVHARGQVASLRTHGRLPPSVLLRAVNARLPDDILVERVAEMPSGFDARRSALRRHYRYAIWNRPLPSLWLRRWTWHVAEPLDLARMEEAASRLVGRRDFASFAGGAAREPADRSTVRTVERAGWRRCGGALVFEITADAFLRHMVRAIVGTLVWIGKGRLATERCDEIVATVDRRQAGPNAPASGLMLIGVDYPEEFGGAAQRGDDDDEDIFPQGERDHASLARDRCRRRPARAAGVAGGATAARQA